MSVLLPLLPGTLPPGICYASEQERLVGFAANLQAILDGQAFYNFGSEIPSAENNAYPWFRTTDGRWYFYSGNWITPANYNLNERRWYAGSLVDLQTFDGGDTDAPSDRSGPMWVEDASFIGRSPMHPGTIPQSDPAKILTVGENYGDGSHALTLDELVPHDHEVKYATSQTGTGFPAITGNGDTEAFSFNTEDSGTGDAMNIVHPCRGLYCIKWSGRIYRRVV